MKTTRRGFLGLLAAIAAAPKAFADGVRHRFFGPLPTPTFDSFIPPSGTAYQWCACAADVGDPLGVLDQWVLAGWKRVPIERYNKSFSIKGEQIEVGGQILMERPRSMVDAARTKEIERATELESEWIESMKEQGFSGEISTPRDYRRF